jgi:hypothetical protein
MKSENKFDRLTGLAPLLSCLLLPTGAVSPFLSSLSVEKAEEEAQKIGLVNAPHLVSFAKSYIEKYQKK